MTVLLGSVVALLGLAAVLTLVRLVRGPGLLDRVVALDCLLVILVMAVATDSSTGQRSGVALSIIVSAALLSFVGTVAFARYVERTRPGADRPGRPGAGDGAGSSSSSGTGSGTGTGTGTER